MRGKNGFEDRLNNIDDGVMNDAVMEMRSGNFSGFGLENEKPVVRFGPIKVIFELPLELGENSFVSQFNMLEIWLKPATSSGKKICLEKVLIVNDLIEHKRLKRE